MRLRLATTALVLLTSAFFTACSGGSGSAPTSTVGALPPGSASTPAPTPVPQAIAPLGVTQTVADLRFGFGPTIAKAPGVDPAGDAKALIAPTFVSPASAPIPGTITLGSYATNERFVLRVPTAWNGKLVVAGTPATRSEFANDAIWSDFVLARGYAFASSNKGIPYNAVVESAGVTSAPTTAYPIAFNPLGFETAGLTLKFGLLTQSVPTTIADWNADFAALTYKMQDQLRALVGKSPTRTYAVGLSNGGAQVRSLIEQHPELVDGGVDWSGVFWSPNASFMDYMPKFNTAMPSYIASGFTDSTAQAAIVAAGYPADIKQGNPAHPSLWSEYFSNVFPYYSDLTIFEYSLYLDPQVASSFSGSKPCVPNASDPVRQPGTCAATGMALPASRASYVPSFFARQKFAAFSHTGAIAKPIVSIAGSADMFITPQNNAVAYLNAVNASGAGSLYHQYIVTGGTHVDSFAAFGYGLQPQAPFAWRAFDQLVDIVEKKAIVPGAGSSIAVSTPSDIPVP